MAQGHSLRRGERSFGKKIEVFVPPFIRNGARPFPTSRRTLVWQKNRSFRSTFHPEWRKTIPYVETNARLAKKSRFSFHRSSGMAQGHSLRRGERSFGKKIGVFVPPFIRNGARPFPTSKRTLVWQKNRGFRSTFHPEWRKTIPYVKLLNIGKTALGIRAVLSVGLDADYSIVIATSGHSSAASRVAS